MCIDGAQGLQPLRIPARVLPAGSPTRARRQVRWPRGSRRRASGAPQPGVTRAGTSVASVRWSGEVGRAGRLWLQRRMAGQENEPASAGSVLMEEAP